MNSKIFFLRNSFLVLVLICVGAPSFAQKTVDVQGRFQCGSAGAGKGSYLNCENAYVHGINFSNKPHTDSFSKVDQTGLFQLEIPVNTDDVKKNEMVFVLRSLDEDRTLGIFYRIDETVYGGLSELFLINQDRDFGALKISAKREIIIAD